MTCAPTHYYDIMSAEQLSALLLSILAVGYTPGPANIFAMSCSVRYGLRKTMRVWLGLLCGFCCAALLATLAAHLAGMAFAAYIPYIRYIAVAYILYLAWKTYRGGISDTAATAPTFASGFIVQLTNAKIILFELSCYSIFVLPYSERFIDLLPVAALLLLAGPGANLVWILAGSALRPFVTAHLRAVSITMSVLLAACAVALLFM